MTRFVVRRLALAALVVLGVVVLTFVIARVVPGDPAATWAGPRARPEQIEKAREELGLDRPLPVQIAEYVGGVASGDWGVSLRTRRPVLDDIGRRAPASIELVTFATLLALAVGDPARPRRRAVEGEDPGRRLAPGRGRRRLDAVVLAGDRPPARVLPVAAPAAGRRHVRPEPRLHEPAPQHHEHADRRRPADRQLGRVRQRAPAHDPARDRDRGLPGRRHHADGARLGAGHDRRGPRADGAGARLPRAERVRALRPAARVEPGRRAARARVRVRAREHVPRRGDLQPAGPRQLRRRRDRRARHAGDPGRHAVRRDRVRDRQPARRHRPGRRSTRGSG